MCQNSDINHGFLTSGSLFATERASPQSILVAAQKSVPRPILTPHRYRLISHSPRNLQLLVYCICIVHKNKQDSIEIGHTNSSYKLINYPAGTLPDGASFADVY